MNVPDECHATPVTAGLSGPALTTGARLALTVTCAVSEIVTALESVTETVTVLTPGVA